MRKFTYLFFLSTIALCSACGHNASQRVTAIEMNRTAVHLCEGETFSLTISKMEGGQKIPSFWSSDLAVAEVDATGRIKAKKEGEAKIIASIDSAKAICTVSVRPLPQKSTVSSRKGSLSATFALPSIDVVGSFLAPASLYTRANSGDPAFDLLFGFGEGESEQAKANIETLSCLASYLQLDDLAKSYAALSSDPSADFSKEKGHIGWMDQTPYAALTTLSNGIETSRHYVQAPFSISFLSSLVEITKLPSFKPKALLDIDFVAALEGLLGKESLSSQQTQGDADSSFDELIVLAQSIHLAKEEETGKDQFRISLDKEGLDSLSSMINHRKEGFHLTHDLTFSSFVCTIGFPNGSSSLTGIDLSFAFDSNGEENSFTGTFQLSETEETIETDYFGILSKAKENW